MPGREIVFDTETTGLEAKDHRIVEIAAIEILDLVPTGRNYHAYVTPLRPCDPDAFRVHGLSDRFLSDKPVMRHVMPAFMAFIGDDPIVAHNASFDVRFINAERRRLGLSPLTNEVVDTLGLSRKRKPGGKHTLDLMCKHFGISTAKRLKHGAMIDTELLAKVYQGLRGGLQASLDLVEEVPVEIELPLPFRPSRLLPGPTYEELLAHGEFVQTLPKPIWAMYEQFEDVDLPFLD